MTEKLNSIRIVAGALDESELRGGTIILRGVVDKDSLKHLQIDSYQREALPIASLSGLMNAVKIGDTLPDIEIGMRGKKVTGRGDDYFLVDPCFIIDGQQRVNAALNVLVHNPVANVRIGATIHLDTTRAWEMDRFRILNSLRNKVSPNILLRNAREKNPGIASLYGLSTNDKAFALYNKVSWSQTMKRGDMLSALLLLKVAGRLHSHKSAGRSTQLSELSRQIEQLGNAFGHGNVRTNVKTFFDIVDECWGLKLIQYREMAPHVRGTFLMTLASVFSSHLDFWQDDESKKLFVEVALKRKLQTFPLHDPTVSNLTSAGGKSSALLFQLLVEHLNRGKRTKHLTLRCAAPELDDELNDAA